MLSAVDGEDDDVIVLRAEVDRVRETIEQRTPRFTVHASKMRRILGDPLDDRVQGRAEGRAESRLTALVPVSCCKGLGSGLRPKTDAACHSRSVRVRRTSLQGIADAGF